MRDLRTLHSLQLTALLFFVLKPSCAPCEPGESSLATLRFLLGAGREGPGALSEPLRFALRVCEASLRSARAAG